MKSIINHILFTFLLTFTSVLFSQQRGNYSQQNSQMSQKAINPENMARIIMYDYDEVIKKLKVKKTPKKSVVISAILKHNNKINEIKTFNYETFDDVKSFLTKKRNEALLNRDFSTMRESQMTANEMLAPIRAKVMRQKTMLNTTFENELTEKQYKTWLKYQQSELKKLNPQSQQQKSNQGSKKGSGQKRGMGRKGY